jgi:hypothetical protein
MGFMAGAGFTLLSADVQLGTVAQYAIQTSAGSVTPTVTVAGGMDPFNAVALGLRPATAGTAPPPGIRIVHVYHVDYQRTSALQFPSTGDLLLCVTAFSTNEENISSMATSPSNTWTKAAVPQQTDFPQIWYATNAGTSPDLTIAPGRAADGNGVTLVFYDITGAASAPYDGVAGVPTAGMLNSSNADLLGMPIITPSTSNGFVVAVMSNGYGPTTGMVDSGFTLDTVTYGNQIDADLLDNSDGYAHYYNTGTSPVSFGWVMNSSTLPEYSAAVAIAFKAGTPLVLALQNGPGGSLLIVGRGIPNCSYTIEAARNLSQPVWQPRATVTADNSGSFEYVDYPPPGVQSLFYRARSN